MDKIEAGINAPSSQEFKTFEEWADNLDNGVVSPRMVVVYHALLDCLVDGLRKDVPEIDIAVLSELKAYSPRMVERITFMAGVVTADIKSARHAVMTCLSEPTTSDAYSARWALRKWIEAAAFWTYAGGGNTWEVTFRGKSIIPVGTLTTKYKKPYIDKSVFCYSALEALRVQKKMKDDFNKSLVFDTQ